MSKLALDNVEWGEFFIGGNTGLFDITSTSSGIDKNKLNQSEGNIPYITRSEENNGINLFVSDEQNSKYQKDTGGVITIGLDTQTVFYQPQEFYTGQNIQILKNEKLSKFSSLFIIPLLKIQMEKFNWGGNGATLTRLKRTRIVLPIDSNSNPNWKFMEDYIKQEMKKQSQRVITYYENKLMKLGFELLDLEDVEWEEFKVKDLFDVKPVKGKSITHYKGGKIPYITTSSVDNGLNNFIDTEENISLKKCISIDPIGGKSFFHEYDFVGRGGAGSAINLLYNNALDKYSGLFICKMLESSSFSKASYGVQLNGNRLKNLKILLPVNKNDEPHWKYMNNFVKKLEKENIEKILNYISIYNH